MEPAR